MAALGILMSGPLSRAFGSDFENEGWRLVNSATRLLMPRILLVEDDMRDMFAATQIASSAGIAEVEARDSLKKGVRYLEACLRGESPPPVAIIVDLALASLISGSNSCACTIQHRCY